MPESFHTRVRAPANIALVKYWGKKGHQLPANPSLSLTLKTCATITDMAAHPAAQPNVELYFEDTRHPEFEAKTREHILALSQLHPELALWHYQIRTLNTFPHSSGIASSASSQAALALALSQLLAHVGKPLSVADTGSMARLGSGSACRSLVDHWAVWGASPLVPGSADTHAVEITPHAAFSNARDTVLVVSSRQKEVSSRAGHKQMAEHPFKEARYIQAERNFRCVWDGLQRGDWVTVGEAMEDEALTLHALMMSQSPGYLLLEPGSLEIIRLVRLFRRESGLPLYFTIDAGPNIHLIYPAEAHEKIDPFIRHELLPFTEGGQGAIWDGVGEGAR
jgi:diphosphomevalonate decarboxylase